MHAREFFLLAVTHRTAPFALRERLSLGGEAQAAFSSALGVLPGLAEFVVVSTCNRVEIYGVAEHPGTAGNVAALFCQHQGFERAAFNESSSALQGEAAVQHLLEVACGFDSQILGETEIFGQIKKAYATAQAAGFTGPVLNRIFQKTFQIAKQVRSHPAIASGVLSIANVAVDLAVKIFGRVDQARILLLGAGDIGTKSGRAFVSRGAVSLTIASRRQQHAAEVAAEIGGVALEFEACASQLHDFDIVVCSTASPEAVLTRESVRAAMERRQGRPVFLIDLAMPRDVEPSTAELANVFLYNLEDLARVADANRSARSAEMARCQPVIISHAERVWRQVTPALEGRSAESFVSGERRCAETPAFAVPAGFAA